uniref:ADAM 17-like protease n=1 Tax=Schistosoma haematobium TaxID=6185 RepID=A0A095A2L1_SCHHA
MIGYGFLLHEIVIHESWTADHGHYNSPTDLGGKIWTATSLLRAFSRFDAKQSCLAHLLSYKRIDEGILGMSWLASPDPKKLGGICSPPRKSLIF